MKIQWVDAAHKFIDELDGAYAIDRKAFIGNKREPGVGTEKAKAAVKELANLKTRLDRFIVTP